MNLDYALIHKYLLKFLENEVKKTGLKSVVLGLSGGLDSAVVAVLADEVFGSDLHCFMMPVRASSTSSLDDARELISTFGLNAKIIDIQPYVDTYKSQNKHYSSLELGNFMSRMRMVTLYDHSAKHQALVLGTSNKSELMLGYGTIYGDLASALNPIGDLYKTQIFEFARYLKIPDSIVSKPPSADLLPNQSDESDLGYTYAQLDAVLIDMVERRMPMYKLLSKYNTTKVKMIEKRLYQNQFKRKMPLIAKLTSRTIGSDFLYPRDIRI